MDQPAGDPGRARHSSGFRTATDGCHGEDSAVGACRGWIADLKTLTGPLPGSPALCFSFLLCCSAFPKAASRVLLFAVCADAGWPHRGCVVLPDEGQHRHQRLHGPDTQGVECRHRRVRAHAVWAHVHGALHALAREQVRRDGARGWSALGAGWVEVQQPRGPGPVCAWGLGQVRVPGGQGLGWSGAERCCVGRGVPGEDEVGLRLGKLACLGLAQLGKVRGRRSGAPSVRACPQGCERLTGRDSAPLGHRDWAVPACADGARGCRALRAVRRAQGGERCLRLHCESVGPRERELHPHTAGAHEPCLLLAGNALAPLPSHSRAAEHGPCLSGQVRGHLPQNHRMVGVGRTLCGSPSPTPCPSRVTQSRLHSTASRQGWNISREGDSTASLGSLFCLLGLKQAEPRLCQTTQIHPILLSSRITDGAELLNTKTQLCRGRRLPFLEEYLAKKKSNS